MFVQEKGRANQPDHARHCQCILMLLMVLSRGNHAYHAIASVELESPPGTILRSSPMKSDFATCMQVHNSSPSLYAAPEEHPKACKIVSAMDPVADRQIVSTDVSRTCARLRSINCWSFQMDFMTAASKVHPSPTNPKISPFNTL